MKRKVQIILFSGKQGSGKTTSVEELKKWALKHDWLFQSVKFADPLYKMHNAILEILDNYGIETPEKDGPLLQMLGTDWGRKQYGNDIWAKLGRAEVDRIIKFWGDSSQKENYPGMVVVDDCRFVNEVEIFPDAIKIRLECDRDTRKGRCPSWRDNENHPSETQFDGADGNSFFNEIFDTGNHVAALKPEEIVDYLVKKYLEA